MSKKLNKSLASNVAISLGRLSIISTDSVASQLQTIAKQWCISLTFIKPGEDKEHAYKGLCLAITRNTQGIAS